VIESIVRIRGRRAGMSSVDAARHTFVFADLAGFTALTEATGVAEHLQVLRAARGSSRLIARQNSTARSAARSSP
jgi:predicted anti-sigma-YlaC factor YlaD